MQQSVSHTNTSVGLARVDWSKLAWPAAILISICGAAVGRAQVSTVAGGGSQPQAQPTPTQNQPANQAQNQAQNQNTQQPAAQPSAGLNQLVQNVTSALTGGQNSQSADVADPFSGKPSSSFNSTAGPADEPRTIKPLRSNAVKVDDNGVVDLRVNGEEVAAVLEMLSLQSQKNIIPHKNVNGKVFANLYGVTFYEALDALLHANGFGYIERGNFIYVYTLEDLQKLEQAARQRVWKVIKLNYISAVDAAAFAQALLSKDSVIKTNAKVGNFPGKSEVPVGGEDYSGESTIMVWDFPEQVEQIEKLIKEIDTRPAQVLVEATILQAQLNENNAFGVDFALLGNLNFGDFLSVGGPLRVPDAMIVNNKSRLSSPSAGDIPVVGPDTVGKAFGLASTPGNTGGPGTLKLGLYNSNVGVFIRMLDEVTDTTILSNPKILALNRQPARVLIGQRIGYLNTTSTNTATTQTVEFLDTGTQLHFRPFVGNDGTIRLELKPSVSSAVIRDVRNSGGSTVTVPDEITNELTTNVIVRDGQTVVLGGLFRESTESARRQVPLLGDIPLVGKAFRGQEDEVSRQEIMFLITPSVVSDSFLAEAGTKSNEIVSRVRAGAREGLLEFSRERLTSQFVSDARKLASEGKNEKALWKLHMALSMNPHQPDAIELKEKLSGTKSSWPNRSMLEDMFSSEQKNAKTRADSGMRNAPAVAAAPASASSAAQPASSVANASNNQSVNTSAQASAQPAAEQSQPAPIQSAQPGQSLPAPQAVATTPAQPSFTPRYDTIQINNRGQVVASTTQHGVNGSQIAQAPQNNQGANPAQAKQRASAFGKLFGVSKPTDGQQPQQTKVTTVPESDTQH
ncbi:MAG TPA: secretin N-terminal domain-containing protein [Phycisphaerales bacterium]